jgi:hypothetical protein
MATRSAGPRARRRRFVRRKTNTIRRPYLCLLCAGDGLNTLASLRGAAADPRFRRRFASARQLDRPSGRARPWTPISTLPLAEIRIDRHARRGIETLWFRGRATWLQKAARLRSRAAFSTFPKKRLRLDAERFCDAGDIVDRHIAFGPLDRAEISSVDAALVGESFLTEPALGAEPAHVLRQNIA